MFSILDEAKLLNEELVSIRRELHRIPELDIDLPKSNQFIKNKLIEFGYTPEDTGQCGITTTIGEGEKTVLLRADYDALPIVEEANVDFKSENGAMHACGHDIHATMLLGTAKLLKKFEDQLNCKVKLMFQPGEETANGAKEMIEAGVLEGIDEAYMIHVVSGANIPSGKFLTTCTGPAFAASTYFELNIKGQGGHGSTPFLTVDPVNIANHIAINLQTITSREMNIFNPAIISIGKIEAGDAYNIIPDKVKLKGTLRSFGRDSFNFVTKRIEEIAKGTATSFRGECDVKIEEIMPSLIQDKELYENTIDTLGKIFNSDQIVPIKDVLGIDKITGSEDFAFVSEEVPTVALFLGLGTGETYGMHHPRVTFDESNMYMGVAAFASVIFDR